MTPFVKIPTIAVYDTQPAARVFPNRMNALPAPLYVSDAADVAQMRPREYQPARPFAQPVRAYSEAFRAVGGEVVRVQQDYK